MQLFFLSLLALATAVTASWTKNLNYKSPSEHHPFMGVSIHRIVKRNNLTCPFEPSQVSYLLWADVLIMF